MKVSKYLFTPMNTPNCSKQQRSDMNKEQIERLIHVANWFNESKFKDDTELYFSIADMVHDEIFVKYCKHH